MNRKQMIEQWKKYWQEEIMVIGFLLVFGFWINSNIELRGLYMDDLNHWYWFHEESLLANVFTIGGSRIRAVFNLASAIEMALIGGRIHWIIPFNIILNTAIAYTVVRFARRLSKNKLIGFGCGFLYMLSRMAYYQIGQMLGLMESMALWMAIGILFGLYQYLNHEKNGERGFWGACVLYFLVCFTHERYMVLIPLFYLVLLMASSRKLLEWLIPTAEFVLVQLIRLFSIGTLSPAGTGGTDVADTFHVREVVKYALSQVCYLFGINMGPYHLNGIRWADTARWLKLVVAAADLVLLAIIIWFIVKLIRDRQNRVMYLKNSALFVAFICGCIVCSSVTIRVEMRWIYVSMTAAWLFLAYMTGVLVKPVGNPVNSAVPARKGSQQEKSQGNPFPDFRRGLACITLFAVYMILTFRVETYYRQYYDNLYYWQHQKEFNSLADETWGHYGEEIYSKRVYILENTFEMSRFYADTFLRTFSNDKGTAPIQFIHSIHEIGQVTENMVILSEDTVNHEYKEVTRLVRNIKCDAVYGFYEDGWSERKSQIRVTTGSTGEINLQLIYPGTLSGNEICAIYMDGEPAQVVGMTSGIMDVTLQAAPYHIAELTFDNNFVTQGAISPWSGEELSMIVKVTAD